MRGMFANLRRSVGSGNWEQDVSYGKILIGLTIIVCAGLGFAFWMGW
jgi:hypothetical protein